MSTPLRITNPDAATPPARDSVQSWLGVLTGMIRAPEAERAGVRDELESHLRDRVRDLMLGGASESEATKQAISELGDAAALARRYQEAIGPSKRRFIMQIAAVGVLSTALGIGGVAFLGGNQPEKAAKQESLATQLENQVLLSYILAAQGTQPEQAEAQRVRLSEFLAARTEVWGVEAPALLDALANARAPEQPASTLRTREFTPPVEEGWLRAEGIKVTVEPDTTWRRLTENVVKGGQGMTVRWEKFLEVGIDPDQPIGVTTNDGTLAGVLKEAVQSLQLPNGQEITLRMRGDTLEFGMQHEFDKSDRTLVTYDVSPLVERRGASLTETERVDEVVEGVVKVVQGLVFADSWADNGGDLAEVRAFGAKLFIKAPKRFHGHIRWVVDELLAEPEAKAGAMKIETRDGVPVLGEVPLLSHLFATNLFATNQNHNVRRGPMLIRVVDGKVELSAPDTRILADEVRVLPDGSWEAGPNAGAWLNVQPILIDSTVAPDSPMTTAIPVSRLNADDARDLLGQVLNIVPHLKECPVPRSLGIAAGDGQVLEIGATAKQIGEIQEIVRALDAQVPAETSVLPSTQTFTLKRIEANAVREMIGLWFNMNPTLKECAVDRKLEVNAETNQIFLTATTEQVNAVARLIQVLDADLR